MKKIFKNKLFVWIASLLFVESVVFLCYQGTQAMKEYPLESYIYMVYVPKYYREHGRWPTSLDGLAAQLDSEYARRGKERFQEMKHVYEKSHPRLIIHESTPDKFLCTLRFGWFPQNARQMLFRKDDVSKYQRTTFSEN